MNDNRWSTDFTPLKNDLHSCKDTSISNWAAVTRLVWDKGWHGANRLKDPKATPEVGRCRYCDKLEDQAHILLECPRGADTRDKLEASILRMNPGHCRIHNLILDYYKISKSNHTLLTGAPNEEARTSIAALFGGLRLSPSEWGTWRKSLRVLGHAARKLQSDHLYSSRRPCKPNTISFAKGRRKSKNKPKSGIG